MTMWRNLLCLLCTALVFTKLTESKKKSKSVTTVLDAKWEQTPLVLEIAEYLAEESSEVFWQFVDGIAALDVPLIDLGTEKAVYDRAMAEASRLLSPAQLSLLRLSVSLHVYSPRVEMYHQMALERGVKCPAAVDVGGSIVCEPHKLEDSVKLALAQPDRVRLETFRLDHHYPGSENKSLVAILYGEVGTPEFAQFHKRLRQLATLQPVDYVLRHFVKERPNRKLRLSGYGVELQLKSTEYKAQDDTKVKGTAGDDATDEDDDGEIEGFVISKLKQLYPDKKEELERLAQELTETSDQLAPLKVWQFQELSLQAAQRILAAPREEALHTFTHIAQNFPMQAKSLVRTVVNGDFKAEMVRNQERFAATLNLQPSDTALFLNGIFFDMDLTDTMAILDSLRQELRVLEGLHASGITDKSLLSSLLGLDLSSGGNGGQDFAIDIRDSAIQWVNDIEVDKQYRRWSASLMDLLRPTFPGMVRHLRRNLYNLVIVGDPSKRSVWPLVKLLESFYVHTAPLRLGLVLAVNSTATGQEDAGVAILNAYNYVAELKDPYQGLSFITDVYASVKTEGERDVEVADVVKLLRARYHADIEEVLGEDTDYDTGRKLAQDFVQRSGLRSLPQALINGIPLPENTLNSDDFEGAVLTEIMSQTPAIQKAVYRGDLTDGMNVLDYLMDQPNVMPRLNERVLNTENSKYLDLVKSAVKLSETMVYVSGGKTQGKDRLQPLTYWLVVDLGRAQDRELLTTALDQMKSSGRMRVGVVINSAPDADQAVNKLVVAALLQDPSVATLSKILKDADAIALGDQHPNAYGLKDVDWEAVEAVLESHRQQAGWVLGFPVGARGLVCNGRVLGPLDSDEQFTADDFSLLERFTMAAHVDKVYNILTKKGDEFEVNSDMVMKAVSLLAARPQHRSRFELPELGEEHSVIKMAARDPSAPALDIAVVVDPVSRGAQKVGPILSVLQQATNCHIRIFLNCVDKHSDMPLKSFYRYVLEPEVQFTAEGQLAPGPMARFSNMPPAPLLTQNMHVPDNWLVESVASPYDLDNIRLEEVQSVVHSQFELEYLLLEGHCFEAGGNPPRGLQITLGTESEPVQVDTIVMANLGYFQLKANPGAWILRLRQGRSADIFDITSHEGSDTPENSTDIKVLISSFRPHVLKLRVTKKPDKLHMDLLGEDDQPNSGLWNSITSTFSSKDEPTDPADETINIFSVASGHLYERFLRIMMLSVLKHTKSPVKFWFLKNYLSPTFKDFLPVMAKEYGFEYELVQYKWPRWLHQQTEKQRIIWGYKILFLDVLFPLHIKKIIFVDADQVVRADMKELVDLDLGGSPYGYTPFCDSRTEMDGFRFWKQGYWRNHLQGRRYHISALYVVDLKRFRKIAAGDRLRGQYQALSQDPNSLSNLDQDLPNNMIHQVAIKSLPQEWLWCETWCDDESKKSAKTIDLCNNPLTKEAKLTAAMRIVEEWKDYDDEIKRLQLRLGATDEHEEEETTVTPPTTSHTEHSEL